MKKSKLMFAFMPFMLVSCGTKLTTQVRFCFNTNLWFEMHYSTVSGNEGYLQLPELDSFFLIKIRSH